MIQTIRKAWGIPELRKKIIFTLLILLIFRIGNAITVPYVNVDALKQQLDVMGATILGLYNVMSGGAFAPATVLAQRIQPEINSGHRPAAGLRLLHADEELRPAERG